MAIIKAIAVVKVQQVVAATIVTYCNMPWHVLNRKLSQIFVTHLDVPTNTTISLTLLQPCQMFERAVILICYKYSCGSGSYQPWQLLREGSSWWTGLFFRRSKPVVLNITHCQGCVCCRWGAKAKRAWYQRLERLPESSQTNSAAGIALTHITLTTLGRGWRGQLSNNNEGYQKLRVGQTLEEFAFEDNVWGEETMYT